MPRLARLLALLFALAAPPAARAQSIAGQVVAAGPRYPVAGQWVRLLRHGAVPRGVLVDSARTDARGLFQFLAPAPGAYQVVVRGGPWVELRGPVDTLAADASVERMFEMVLGGADPEHALFEFQVETPVIALGARFGLARYPEDLRAQNLEGDVLIQFVVDTLGHPIPATIRVLRASHPGFVQAVRDAIADQRFRPATLDGRPVFQLVQQPFEFRLR
jgi:TonB family protein